MSGQNTSSGSFSF